MLTVLGRLKSECVICLGVGKGNIIVAWSRSRKTYFKKSTPLEIYIKGLFSLCRVYIHTFLEFLKLNT